MLRKFNEKLLQQVFLAWIRSKRENGGCFRIFEQCLRKAVLKEKHLLFP